jgi:DnaK suppressor protein
MAFDDLRQSLLKQRRTLLERVAHAEEDLRWLDTNVEIESAEEGQEENIARLLSRLDDQGRAEIDAIDAALARIAGGNYGKCEGCGEAIPLPRLRAVPTTTRCLECATREELNTRR